MKVQNIRKIVICMLMAMTALFVVPMIGLAVSVTNNPTLADPYDYFTEEEQTAIIETAQALPERYRYLIIPSDTNEYDIKTDAKKIFNNLDFSQDTIFILIYSGKREIYITTGDLLEQKNLNDQFFQQEIETYFIPYVSDTSNVAGALIELTKGISKDIPSQLDTFKNEVTIPISPDSDSSVLLNCDEEGLNPWIVIVSIIVLLLVILLIIIIMLNRKRSNAKQ